MTTPTLEAPVRAAESRELSRLVPHQFPNRGDRRRSWSWRWRSASGSTTARRSLKAENADKKLLAAKQSLGSGNMPLAQSDLKKVADQYPETSAGAEAGMLLAQLKLEQGDNQGAVTSLKELTAQDRVGPVRGARSARSSATPTRSSASLPKRQPSTSRPRWRRRCRTSGRCCWRSSAGRRPPQVTWQGAGGLAGAGGPDRQRRPGGRGAGAAGRAAGDRGEGIGIAASSSRNGWAIGVGEPIHKIERWTGSYEEPVVHLASVVARPGESSGGPRCRDRGAWPRRDEHVAGDLALDCSASSRAWRARIEGRGSRQDNDSGPYSAVRKVRIRCIM